MCRHWGVSYGPGGPEAEEWSPSEIAQIMFPALVARGKHAWGWAVNVENEIYMDKHPGRSDEPEAIQKMVLPDNPKWIIGHTRHATHGDPADNRNNHPLQHGNILGAHNGVLINHESILKETGRWVEGTEVDSEAILAAVNKWGHLEGLKRIVGSMVAVYIRLDYKNTINIARSYGRELFIARTKTGSLYWSSETAALDALGVNFTSIEAMGGYQLLKVRGGRVRGRQTYQAPKPAPTDSLGPQRQARRVQGGALGSGASRPVGSVVGGRGGAGGARSRRERTARAEALEEAREFIASKRAELNIAPRFGEKRKGLYWVGGKEGWVTEREFIAYVLDENDWS